VEAETPEKMTMKISGLMPLLERQASCAFYRWKFIRRSEFYRTDVDRFFELFGDWLCSHGVEIEKLPEYTPRVWLVEIQPKWLADAQSKEFYHSRIGPFLLIRDRDNSAPIACQPMDRSFSRFVEDRFEEARARGTLKKRDRVSHNRMAHWGRYR
jgi:hypothetical protein